MSGIRDQLVWDRLLAIVEEQAQTLMRTAFSTVVREAGDLSAGVFDTRGAMLAQAVTGTPGHVNAMAASVGTFLARFPLATLAPGDVLVTNDPWDATGHLNDFTVVTPVFDGARPVALFAATSHIADVGGRGFGPDGRELFEEGLRIPIMKLFDRGALNGALMDVLKANVRDPVVAEGDLYSLHACNRIGGERLLAALREFDLPDVDRVGGWLIDASRQAMAAAIEAVPDGVYRHDMEVDGYDEPVCIACAVTVAGGRLAIDFTGTSGLSTYGINVPMNYTAAYASFGVRCVIGNDVPNNAGSLAPVTVHAPAGCILNAPFPAAVSARHAVGQMLPDVVLGCLDQALPGVVPAEGASCIWNPVLRNAGPAGAAGGNVAATPFVINPVFNGGTGARAAKDGLSTTAFPSGVRTTPTEVNEVTAPLLFRRREFRAGSGGDGEFRGGLGQVIEIDHAQGAPFVVSKMFDRIGHPAHGRRGGAPGAPGRVYLNGGATLRGKGQDVVPAGATLVMETPGGGGVGDPAKRSATARRADEEDELV